MGRRRERGPRWLATGEPIQAPEPLPQHEIEAAVEDGLRIARFSVELALTNRLIVSSLRDQVDFDPERSAAIAREVLETMAVEQDENVQRADEVLARAADDSGIARNEHDYKARDSALLSARRQVYEQIAVALRRDAGDPEKVAGLVDDARLRAWDEVGREVTARLDDVRRSSSIVVDADYLRDRDERMRRVREFDLWELADQHYGKADSARKATSRTSGMKGRGSKR